MTDALAGMNHGGKFQWIKVVQALSQGMQSGGSVITIINCASESASAIIDKSKSLFIDAFLCVNMKSNY